MDATTVTLIGEGTVEWEFELPLGEVYADQVKQGKLTPKTEDDRSALSDLFATGDEQATVEEPPAELTLADRIDALGSHAEANALAAELGVESFGEKTPKIDEKKAALHDAAAAAQSA